MTLLRQLHAGRALLLITLTLVAAVAVAGATRKPSGMTVTRERDTITEGTAIQTQQPRTAPGCDRCHAELELLRQQVSTLTRARKLLVPDSVVASSAHADMSCASCHTGFARFPHAERGVATATCESCHEAAAGLWRQGAHAGKDEPVQCTDCHTVHAVADTATLRSEAGAATASAPCLGCHEADAIAPHDPHARGVSCAGCHAPHDTRATDDTASWLAGARQAHTCAACHDSTAHVWQQDIHGDTVLQRMHRGPRAVATDGPVLCTSCHPGHTMRAAQDTLFAVQSVTRCAECHARATQTFFASYHGKATTLGSAVSASCADCHGAHDVLPDTFAAARVASANLVETCRACHAHARPRFVLYDAHPDPFNRARNPWIFFSFWLMNGLLIFVIVVFGAHTLLWWVRLWLDRRRGLGHDHGAAA